MDFIREAVRQNEHWETGEIKFHRLDGPLVEREVAREFEKSVDKKFITILRGLRRTGKSVLARKLLRDAIARGAEPSQLAWFEFDRTMKATPEDLDSLIEFFKNKGAKTIVLDEAAFVPGWQDVLKRFYDGTDLKFIATGSSALEVDERSAESLAGRFDAVFVKPFSFKEYLLLKGKRVPSTALEFAESGEELELECDDYIRVGGLPEAIGLKTGEDRAKYVKNSLLEPLFYKYLPAVFPEANPDLLLKTLELLCATAGSEFQFQTLAQILGYSHPTAALQVEILGRALVARVAYNNTPSVMKQKRTAKKIVVSDNGILAALKPDVPVGVLAENAVANHADAAFFWRDAEGREVDVVLPAEKTAFEVKYQEHVISSDEKNLRYFLERHSGWKGVLVTKSEEKPGTIPRVPLWKWLLEKPAAIPASQPQDNP